MKTQIVCHRGACRHAPENTIASGLAAARLGGDIVELDVRQSRDGVLYVLHDAKVDRTTNGTGAIAQMTSADLDRLDAGEWFGLAFTGERLPRLDGFFEALKDKVGFYVEVKAADPEAVAAAIRRAGIEDRCFTYSETAEMRDGMRKAAPWLKRMVNWRNLRAISEAHDRGVAILEFHAPDFKPDRLAEARAERLEVMVHTPLDDTGAFRAALTAQVEYLNIDFPDVASQMRSEIQ
jgi:glycerophosphoryl diester phosphodiesterase